MKIKKGALSRQLGIPIKKDIPKTLLDKIIKAKKGQLIENPTKQGKAEIRITKLLEKRAIFAKNFRK